MIDWCDKKFENILLNLLQEIETVARKKKKGNGFKFGQREAVMALYNKLRNHGAILADEVGLGKTRVALILMEAVLRAGGSVAAVVPGGLMFQWEEEAKSFSNFLENACITRKIVRLSGFNDLFSNDVESYPLSMNDGEKYQWPLISHRFGPILSNATNKEQYAFFEYVAYRLQTKMEGKKWSRFLNKFKKPKERENARGIELAGEFLKPHNDNSFKFLKDITFAPLRKPTGINKLKDESGALSRHVIKRLIGRIDFLVIDEAHKGKSSLVVNDDASRDEEGIEYKTRLASLLDDILDVGDGRKLCMTATPVELTTDNWTQILKRCGIKDVKKKVFDDFHLALNEIRSNPTNEKLLQSLENASKEFQEYLQNFVVRRLRCHQDEYIKLARKLKYGDTAHIHRLSRLERIEMNPGSQWQKVVMCSEGIMLAAKGLPGKKNTKYRIMQTRYPAGLIDDPESIESVDLKTIKNPKEKRMYFWRNQAAFFCKSATVHPRIEKTADLIERILKENECKKYLAKESEKVLVFGTYTKPMEQLQSELNRRDYVRRVVEGKLIQNKVNDETEKKQIYSVYLRLYGENKSENEKTVFLPMTHKSFFEKANKLHEEYEKYRDGILKVISDNDLKLAQRFDEDEKIYFENEEFDYEKTTFFEEKIRYKPKLYSSIIDYLKKDLLNWLVDDYDYTTVDKSEEKISRAEYLRKKLKILARGFLQDLKDSTKGKKKKNVDDNSKVSDRDIEKYINETEDDVVGGRSSKFCRLMNGASDGNTKRRLQRQFNISRMSPKVLIAQSLVGREGLNLHKCCRHVVLLHPEWNPGTVEQEIGRVDRIDSLWNHIAEKWLVNNPQGETEQNRCPRIEVHYVVFDGTYDQLHFEVLETRMNDLNAQLFGSLLDTNDNIPEGVVRRLKAAAPDFDPAKDKIC